ncbi:MAG: hypothetical protein IJR51_10290 [Clostridia bacterium]|nr:hypothetical protein [Clostridia bacterium]MBQ9507533.1 hypothetical protein [Clostridia bacterium]
MPAPAEGLAIGREEVSAAAATLQKYRAAKRKLEARIEENEQWFRMRHWEQLRLEQGDGRKASAWLFNSIMNKHADFMDAVPECTVLPREASDTAAAEALTSVLPVIFERCDFGGVYADAAMQKLKTGTAVYSVLWDPRAAGGMGDVAVTNADIFRVFWEPGVRDIQKSRNLFCLELQDNDLLVEQYPFLEGRLGGAGETAAYLYDKDVDTTGKSTVVDWYYKRSVGGRQVLHYVKFVNDTVLFASENEEAYRLRGWYDHGKYPFVFDPLFKEEGTPVGFGFIDVMKDAQEEIDILGNEILKNARMGARRRFFIRGDGAVNEEEFADFSRDFVHVNGSSLGEEALREISAAPLSPVYVTVLNNKVNELKETSGNRDFSTGGTMGGVTSGTAISALQEAGSKLSRDMISATYRAFSEICTLTVELVRQFYNVPRSMRILGPNGEWQFTDYDNSALQPGPESNEFGVDFAARAPVFDMSVKAHKQNTFSRAAQNNDALNFYQLGFFDPAKSVQSLACLQLIDIDNKEKLMNVIEENGRACGYLPPRPAAAGEGAG